MHGLREDNTYMFIHKDKLKCIILCLMYIGYIGEGMLSASISGYVFTCCSSLNIYQAIKYLNNYNC